MNHIPRDRRAGVILCGGKSSRMGRPKLALELAGRTFLQCVVDALAPCVDRIVIVAADGQELPALECPVSVNVVRDSLAHEGPLAGAVEGFAHIADSYDACYLSSCDTPLLSTSWVDFIFSELVDAEIAVPFVGERLHPLSAAYRKSVFGTAKRRFDAGQRRPICFYDDHKVNHLNEDALRHIDSQLAALENANAPEDLARLEAIFRTLAKRNDY